ncbi:MAG: GntR family transcriptional regulator [Sphingomonadaceae bacterium]
MNRSALKLDLDHSNGTKVYLALKQSIIANQFVPGEALVEQKLADLYQVSRTPVREALQRLAKDGLVEMVPRRGAFVARLSLEDAVEIFRMREALEGMAARLAASAMAESEIDRLERVLREAASSPAPERLRAMYEAGGTLHEAILQASGSPRMRAAVNQLLDQITRLRMVAIRASGRIEESFDQHLGIVEALRRRDPDGCEREMRSHLSSTLGTITRVIMGGGY